jgi:hypothetical protein
VGKSVQRLVVLEINCNSVSFCSDTSLAFSISLFALLAFFLFFLDYSDFFSLLLEFAIYLFEGLSLLDSFKDYLIAF